ncbi:MAG: FUSC family membrane protein [Ferruginibacter sp.]
MYVGIALPAFILGYLNLLDIGIVLSTGALCVSVTDSAGPIRHRANGMFFCVLIIGLTSIIIYWSLYSLITVSVAILLMGFIFSMLSVYNARVSSVGVSALLVMILSMQAPIRGNEIFLHALYLISGGIWYMIFSLALHSLKPYKLIQQLSGEFISGVADYLKSRASFYDDDPDYESVYRALLQQQVTIQAQQTALNEMLFKTRAITKNSTRAGRSLLKIYLDVSDLFESIMSAYQQYEVLHKRFDETGILELYRQQLVRLAEELADIAYAVGAGQSSKQQDRNIENLVVLKGKLDLLRKNFMTEKNLEDFIGLGRIFNNIRDLTYTINSLHYYTAYDKLQRKEPAPIPDLQRFNEAQTIDPALFMNNLNFRSNIFRHSLRVALSLLAGFIVSLLFGIGHSYWILLTIVVILKPAYSLSKSRNADRLLGTIAGLVIGVGILFTVKHNLSLLIIMVIFMAGTYMFIRTRYFISVLFMTVYLVLFFHIVYPGSITSVLRDRLLDTAIGSVIAFLSSLFFVPAWEHEGIRKLMQDALDANISYYKCLSRNFTDEQPINKEELKKAGRLALTALANVSDAFNRMLSEPKRFQKQMETIYRFVVLNHILSSHFAALSFYLNEQKEVFRSPALKPFIDNTTGGFRSSLNLLSGEPVREETTAVEMLEGINKEEDILFALRKTEIAAGNLETSTKTKLIRSRSVTDQFRFINNLSADIFKNVTAFTKEDTGQSR